MNKITGNESFTNEVMKKHKKEYKDIHEFINSIK